MSNNSIKKWILNTILHISLLLKSNNLKIVFVLCLIFVPDAAGQTKLVGIKPVAPLGGPLSDIDVSAKGGYIATSSRGKVVNIWLSDGSSHQTIHLPEREELPSSGYAVSIHPQGDLIAVSVPPLIHSNQAYKLGTGRIYLYSRRTGELTGTIIGAFPTHVTKLRFSPGGQYLAAILNDGCGLRIWRTDEWTKPFIAIDEGYAGTENPACGKSANPSLPDNSDLAFAPGKSSGAWLAVSGETGLRIYGRPEKGTPLLRHLSAVKDLGLDHPAGIAFNRDGKRLAIGDTRNLRVAIVDMKDMTPEAGSPVDLATTTVLTKEGLLQANANRRFLTQVLWTHQDDEEWLNAAGFLTTATLGPEYRDANNNAIYSDNNIVSWRGGKLNSRPLFRQIGNNTIGRLLSIDEGKKVLLATEIQLYSLPVYQGLPHISGRKRLITGGQGVDFRGSNLLFRVSKDGRRVVFAGYFTGEGLAGDGMRIFWLDLSLLEFTSKFYETWDSFYAEWIRIDEDHRKDFFPSNTDPKFVHDYFRKRLSDSRDGWPNFFGRNFADTASIDTGEISRSATKISLNAFASRGRDYVVWGTSDAIRVIDEEAKVVCERHVSSDAFRINATSNGRIAIVGHGDGTIRWYRIDLHRKEKCLSLLLTANFRQNTQTGDWSWAAWRPDGFFFEDASEPMGCWQIQIDDDVDCIGIEETLERYYNRKKIEDALIISHSKETPPPDLKSRFSEENKRTYDLSRKFLKKNPESVTSIFHRLYLDFKMPDYDPWTPPLLRIKYGNTSLKLRYGNENVSLPYGRDPPVEQIRIAHPQGNEIGLRIPPLARRSRNSDFKLCFELKANSQDQSASETKCVKFKWDGKPTERPESRKLWAVLVGFSDTQVQGGQLLHAHDDALDFAKFLIDDFLAQNRMDTEERDPDFDKIHIDLFVAPPNARKDPSQLDENAKIKHLEGNSVSELLRSFDSSVTIHPLKKKHKTVEELIEGRLEDLKPDVSYSDLFILFYSGHGRTRTIEKSGSTKRENITELVSPFSEPALLGSKANMIDLADWMKEIAGIAAPKLIFIDACRTVAVRSIEETGTRFGRFDVTLPYKTLTKLVPDEDQGSHLFFSAKTGYASFEQDALSSNDILQLWPRDILETKKGKWGNSVFSLGLMFSLACKESYEDDFDNMRSPDEINSFFSRAYFSKKYSIWNKIRDNIESNNDKIKKTKILSNPPLPIKRTSSGLWDERNIRTIFPSDRACLERFLIQQSP